MINQYPPVKEEHLEKTNKLWYIIIAVVILGLLSFILFKVMTSTALCGNGVCEAEENCYDCSEDCKCEEGKYCSAEKKECVEPDCGNGVCEIFESSENCCLDCECAIPGEICNEETKKCELQEMEISDERAKELAISYYENESLVVVSTEVIKTTVYDEKLIKQVRVQISGEQWFRYVGVTDDEEVMELPII